MWKVIAVGMWLMFIGFVVGFLLAHFRIYNI